MEQLVIEFLEKKEIIRFIKDDKCYLYTNFGLIVFNVEDLYQPFQSKGILKLKNTNGLDIYFISANEITQLDLKDNNYFSNLHYVSYRLLEICYNDLLKFLYET